MQKCGIKGALGEQLGEWKGTRNYIGTGRCAPFGGVHLCMCESPKEKTMNLAHLLYLHTPKVYTCALGTLVHQLAIKNLQFLKKNPNSSI